MRYLLDIVLDKSSAIARQLVCAYKYVSPPLASKSWITKKNNAVTWRTVKTLRSPREGEGQKNVKWCQSYQQQKLQVAKKMLESEKVKRKVAANFSD